MKLLGKPIADAWLGETKEQLLRLQKAGRPAPQLAIVQVGDQAESTTYINRKVAIAKQIGVTAEVLRLPISATIQDVVNRIMGASTKATGIIVQLPLPAHISRATVLDAIPTTKDIDGLSRASLGALVRDESGFIPATPRAILRIIQHTGRTIAGLRVAIVGAGLLVGKPLAIALTNGGATVVLIEKNERDTAALCKTADVLVACAGQPGMITKEFVHKKMLVIDAGFTVSDGKLLGDVDPAVEEYCEALTPVPGGVGPVTVAALMANLLAAC